MQTSLTNPDFTRSVDSLRRILPGLSFSLLIGTYLISAVIMGLFYAKGSESLGFTIAAFIVPLAIQAGRGTLVFFFQLNPARVQRKLSFGIVAATVLLALSLCEACLVMWPYGLSWTVSVATLMIIGWIIEVMILRETQFTSELDLYSNPERIRDLQQFYTAKKEFEAFMQSLRENPMEDIPNFQETPSRRVSGEKKKYVPAFRKEPINSSRLGK